jgi:hypothetical protein
MQSNNIGPTSLRAGTGRLGGLSPLFFKRMAGVTPKYAAPLSEKRDRSMSDQSGSISYNEACGLERLAPERRGPRPASEEGKLELTEALRSNDRS